jgi:hypothetical protein
MLKGYNSEKVKFLVDGFTSGFRIPYNAINGNDTHRLPKNLRSASENFEILQKEKNAGRVRNTKTRSKTIYQKFYLFTVIPF